nr:MAG TPA: minor tail protein [Caudoviricetes sp.]
MSTNVGSVDFELLLNSNPFNKGLKDTTNTIKSSGIENSLKKIGKLAVAAFSVKAIVNFGKECIDLGSDLTEVQNVVDVTFGSLNTEVNRFAENAITQFGLGQTVTKKYVGTFGAMAKAFNFSNKEALAMSETLTGLTGDVASFYNLSSDEAYTKLKSVFTGETETLKDLGVVMTQNALDQYALANGYGKTTSKMSEQEKVALRYKFVLDKLNIANGDFARTSDSWANQTRVLGLRFNELKATLGQGFINIFTPIVKGINMVLSKLQVLANAFKSFTEMIFGNAGGDDSTSNVSNLASDASKASDAVSGIGDSAKKSAKDLKSLASFDTAQILKKDDSDSSSSGSGSGGIDTSGLGDLTNSAMQQANAQMDNFIKKSKELFSIFKEGFDDAFENTNFDGIIDSCERIKTALTEIFTDSDITEYAAEWVDTVLYNMGRMTGSVASVGVTIADNLLGGFANFLEQNEEDIQEHIMNIFSISSESWDLLGDISETFADIFAVFRGPEAKQCTADIIAIFTDGILGVYEIVGKFTNDILYIIAQPFIENKDLIKNALEGLLQPISSVLETIKQGIQDTFSKFWEVYDTYIRPAVENIKDGFSSILETILNVWNENIKPILDEWESRFDLLWKEHLQPMVNNFLEFFGKLINGISTLWNTWLVPIINWIVANVIPVLSPIFETIGNLFMDVFGVISDILNGVWQVLGGLIDFIVGVFTGDWEKAWNGIESIFSGIWTMIKGILEGIWNAIKDIIKGAIDYVKNYINMVMSGIKSIWENIWNGIKSFASNIWNGIKGIFSGVGSWFSNIFQQAYNGITRVFSNIGNFFSGIWQRIKNTFSNLGTSIGNAISNAVKSGINGVISLIERTINRAISSINGGIDLINLIPGVSVRKIGSLNLPRLAQGGYVKANTPQLAMIGDNRHQGEVVAPEDKLMSLYKKANQEMGLGNNEKVIELLEKIIQILINLSLDFNLYIDGYELNKRLEKIKNKNRFATNGG